MPGADDQQVDFVIGDAGVDPGEDLPGAFDPMPGRQLRLGVLALAAVVVVGGLIARAASSHDGAPSAQASPSASSSPSDETNTPDPVSLTPAIYPHPATYAKQCPLDERSRSLCTNANPLPAQVVAAVHDHFPSARISSSTEEELRDIGFGSGMLYYRELHAHAGTVTIGIEVRPLIDADRRVTKARPTSIILQRLTPGDTIRVTVTDTAGRLPTVKAVAALANDDRLAVDG